MDNLQKRVEKSPLGKLFKRHTKTASNPRKTEVIFVEPSTGPADPGTVLTPLFSSMEWDHMMDGCKPPAEKFDVSSQSSGSEDGSYREVVRSQLVTAKEKLERRIKLEEEKMRAQLADYQAHEKRSQQTEEQSGQQDKPPRPTQETLDRLQQEVQEARWARERERYRLEQLMAPSSTKQEQAEMDALTATFPRPVTSTPIGYYPPGQDPPKVSRSVTETNTKVDQKVVDVESLEMKKVDRAARKMKGCDGEKVEDVKEWLKNVEYSGLDEELKIKLAYDTARGRLFREIVRFPSKTWEDLKKHVTQTFVAHNYQALVKRSLQKVKQDPKESLRAFNLRFREMAEEAYPYATLAEREIIVNAYLAALSAERIVDKVLENGFSPDNLDEAMEAALKYDIVEELKRAAGRDGRREKINELRESQVNSEITDQVATLTKVVSELSKTQKTLMNVDPPPVNPVNADPVKPMGLKIVCQWCKKTGHAADKCFELNKSKGNERWNRYEGNEEKWGQNKNRWTQEGNDRWNKSDGNEGKWGQNKYKWTQDGRPICLKCQQAGHVERRCPGNFQKGTGNY